MVSTTTGIHQERDRGAQIAEAIGAGQTFHNLLKYPPANFYNCITSIF